jgi:hypothetical protein
VLKTDADPAAACDSTSDGNVLNSPEVGITALSFADNGDGSYGIVIKGRLKNAPTGSNLAAVEREFRETVYVRSGPVN